MKKRENSHWTREKRFEIYDLFENQGLTQDEIVDRLGYSRQQVTRVLRGYESNGMLSRPLELVTENKTYYAKLNDWKPVKPKVNPDIAFGELLYKAELVGAVKFMEAMGKIKRLEEGKRDDQ